MRHHKFPRDPADCADFRQAIRKYVLPGFIPGAPFIPRQRQVVSAGSCFAGNVAEALSMVSVPALHLKYGENLNTPVSTDALIEKCVAGAPGHEAARDALAESHVFILTVGVALSPFRDSKPVAEFSLNEIDSLEWGLLGPIEVRDYIKAMIGRLRSLNQNMTVVLTVSPLPLNSSFGHPSVFGQDCLSKCSLRFGVEMVMQEKLPNVFYWPSFEMVRWLAPHIGQVFGTGDADNRHISKEMIGVITELFIETFFLPAQAEAPTSS